MTIEIPLTQGKVALIDDEDLPLVAGRKWYALKVDKTFYAASWTRLSEGPKKLLLMHRVILGASGGKLIDHRDRNGLNNLRANLRPCTAGQNNVNRPPRGKKSKYKGITALVSGRWQASISERYLGTFTLEEDAARAYDAAAKSLHGEFAYLNFE